MPKPARSSLSAAENKSPERGMKWSFAPGTNLLSGFTAKVDRESKQKLNEFAKQLRAFRSVDMSGMLRLLLLRLSQCNFYFLHLIIYPGTSFFLIFFFFGGGGVLSASY